MSGLDGVRISQWGWRCFVQDLPPLGVRYQRSNQNE
jgi:hypothetical protein